MCDIITVGRGEKCFQFTSKNRRLRKEEYEDIILQVTEVMKRRKTVVAFIINPVQRRRENCSRFISQTLDWEGERERECS